LNFKLVLGTIGIVLIAFNIVFLIPFAYGFPLMFLMWSYFQVFLDVTIGYGSFLSTITAGLGLYIFGRKDFLNHLKKSKIASVLLTISGVILIGASLWFLLLAIMILHSSFGAPPTTVRDWIIDMMLFSWDGLSFCSGVLWVADGSKMGEDRALPVKKEIDFEEAWKKYPKDLFAEYVERYPHNPEGVLEWHINKKMKEGKTREQAIEELIKESK